MLYDDLEGGMERGGRVKGEGIYIYIHLIFSLGSLHWEHRVLATGPSGKSLFSVLCARKPTLEASEALSD